MEQPPPSSSRYQVMAAAVAARAGVEAAGAETLGAAALKVLQYQAASVAQVQQATTLILADQGEAIAPDGLIQPVAFTTPLDSVEAMLASIEAEAEQLSRQIEFVAASLVQDAARLAQQVDVTLRPRVQYVRHLTPPSCSRCAVLAGRVYRWSQGFLRHPRCDCTMLPTTVAAEFVADPVDLARRGLVTGLSKGDRKALADGADFNQVANAKRGVRQAKIGGVTVQVTSEGVTKRGLAGNRLGKRARLTPNEVYRQAGSDRALAIRLLKKHGYVI